MSAEKIHTITCNFNTSVNIPKDGLPNARFIAYPFPTLPIIFLPPTPELSFTAHTYLTFWNSKRVDQRLVIFKICVT
jgi:hypothetical protein